MKITQLTEMTDVANDDYLEVMDQSGTAGNDSRNMRILRRENLFKYRVTTLTASTTLDDNHELLLLNPTNGAACTITLPAVSGRNGKTYILMHIHQNCLPVVIDGNASETINGKTTILLEEHFQLIYLYCDGTQWWAEYSNLDNQPERNWYRHYDFEQNLDTNGKVGGTILFTKNGAAGTVLQIAGEANHAGIVRLTTATTSGNDVTIHTGGTSALNTIQPSVAASYTFMIRVPTITSVSVRMGIAATSAHDTMGGTNSHWGFLFDPATSANWICSNADGTTQVTTTSSIAVTANQWYKMKIAKQGGNFHFYIDNAFIATHSTNAPTGASNIAVAVQTNTAAARTVDVDYIRCHARTMAR